MSCLNINEYHLIDSILIIHQEQLVLVSQLQEIQDLITERGDKSTFIVHVGDLMSAYFSQCREERYATISSILKSSIAIPILTTPGDNEWNRCPDSNLAVANYTKYFIGIEDQWKGTSNIAKMIKRSTTRPENWVFFYSKVLFLALNMVDEDDSTSGFDVKSRLQDNLKWFERNCSKYCLDARGSYGSIPLDVIIIVDTVSLTYLFLLPWYFSCNNFWTLHHKF